MTPSLLLQLTDKNFEEHLAKHPSLVVDFWASWCGPCQRLHPILEALCKKWASQVAIGSMNIEEHQDIPGKFHIMSIPTLIFFRHGKEVGRKAGFWEESVLDEWIRSLHD